MSAALEAWYRSRWVKMGETWGRGGAFRVALLGFALALGACADSLEPRSSPRDAIQLPDAAYGAVGTPDSPEPSEDPRGLDAAIGGRGDFDADATSVDGGDRADAEVPAAGRCPEGDACDDQRACTVDDRCDAEGVCRGNLARGCLIERRCEPPGQLERGACEPVFDAHALVQTRCATTLSSNEPCNERDRCSLGSGFPGDEMCLLPPAHADGLQIRLGPETYGAAGAADYRLEPGASFEGSFLVPLLDGTEHFYKRIVVTSRLPMWWHAQLVADRMTPGVYRDDTCGGQTFKGSLGSGGSLVYNDMPRGDFPAELDGVGARIGPGSLCVHVHAFNDSDEPALLEQWYNLYFVDSEDVISRPIEFVEIRGGQDYAIADGVIEARTYSRVFGSDGQLTRLAVHHHAWTTRVTVWLNETPIADLRNQFGDPSVIPFDSSTQNHPVMLDGPGLVEGAHSGILPVQAGDTLTITCQVENLSGATLAFGHGPGQETCLLHGKAVGATFTEEPAHPVLPPKLP